MLDGTIESPRTSPKPRKKRGREGRLEARVPRVAFEDVPRRWFGQSVMGTHICNGVNLLFPAGERFFIRSVRHYLAQIEDEELAADVRGFFAQEGRHAQLHERFFETLRAQGYEIDHAILEPTSRIA